MLFQRRPPTESVYAVNELILDRAPGGTLFRSKNSPRDTNSSESGLGKIVSERDAASVTSRDGESGEEPETCFYPRSFYPKRRLLVKAGSRSVDRRVAPGGPNLPDWFGHFCVGEGPSGSLRNRTVVKSVR
jgi:hypothetical protein